MNYSFEIIKKAVKADDINAVSNMTTEFLVQNAKTVNDSYEMPIIHHCISLEMMKVLVSKGLDVNEEAESPLLLNFLNSKLFSFDFLRLILESGYYLDTIDEETGCTPVGLVLMFSKHSLANQIAICVFLIQHGSRVTDDDLLRIAYYKAVLFYENRRQSDFYDEPVESESDPRVYFYKIELKRMSNRWRCAESCSIR